MKNAHLAKLQGNHAHFIGIGGISMSGLAEILLHRGYTVSGSDIKESHLTRRLAEKGARIYIGHHSSHIKGADWVVFTAAIPQDNPEIVAAKLQGIPVIERAPLLGELMKTFPYSIGVSGTHGKTTTTSMLSIILQHARLDPTVLVGGELDDIGGNVRIGNSRYFITEACEYHESFLSFSSYIAIILNIDEDHLDFFKDIDEIYEAFVKYSALVPPKGYVIGCEDDPLVSRLLKKVQSNKISFSIEGEGDWVAQNIVFDHRGCPSYRVSYKGQDMGRFTLQVPGRYNIYNALAASVAAWAIGISCDTIREALASFQGTHRRFEVKGNTKDVTIIDDYAHHPTEIRATLEAARQYPHKRIWCIFQPHTYTRTQKLFYEFADSFLDADEVIITDIYGAREKSIDGVNSEGLAKAVVDNGHSCRYLSSFEETVDFLEKNTRPGDIVLTMGAGNIFEVGDQFLKKDIP